MNILFITRLYPSDCYDNQQTGMGHYICREWVKAGHNVQVIHEDMRFNKRWSPEEQALPETRRFVLENVPVSFIKINRPFPGWRYLPGSQAKKAEKFICNEVKRWGHQPDVIFAFFCYDQWKVIQRVRQHFDCPVVPIFHNCDVKFSDKQVGRIMDSVEVSGGVSKKILAKLHAIRPEAKTFMCYGGAPNDVAEYYKGETHNEVFTIVYAGMLIPLKKVDITLRALGTLKDRCDFRFVIIGDGEERETLEALTAELGLSERVEFRGRVKRTEVLAEMGKADCFAMASSPETFGLTYLEAMACGDYVIGSKGEGIDGVLVDGENGVLVTPGSVEEMADALERWFTQPEQVKEMQRRGIETANRLTEEKVAAMILTDCGF